MRGKLDGEKIIVEVEDECGGLPNDGKDLFKPFVQKNNDRTGLGLGLAIAQKGAELNHGTIEARSLPGKGCIFKITLPKRIPTDPPSNFTEHSTPKQGDEGIHHSH